MRKNVLDVCVMSAAMMQCAYSSLQTAVMVACHCVWQCVAYQKPFRFLSKAQTSRGDDIQMRSATTFDRGVSLIANQSAEMNTHDPNAVHAALTVRASLFVLVAVMLDTD